MNRITDVVDRIGMRLSASLMVDGLWIGVLPRDDVALLERTRDALRWIELHDPVRYARIRHDIAKIWITTEPRGNGLYAHRLKLIVLDARYVRDAEPEIIASLIVHEAAHARLIRFGYDETLRARIERCCIRREAAFARRYPGGEAIVEWALQRQRVADEIWSDDALEERRCAREIEAAREVGVPAWLVRFAHRLRGRIGQERARTS